MSSKIIELKKTDFGEIKPVITNGESELNTDADIARLFLEYAGDDLRYVSDEKTWIVWNGRYWEEDVKNKRFEKLLEFREDLLKKPEISNSKEKKKKVNKLGNDLSSKRIMNEMTKIGGSHKIMQKDLDAHDSMLNLNNCILDLEKCEIKEHKKEYLFTKCIDINYAEMAKCERWLTFLLEVFDEDEYMINYIQKLFGYCLTSEVNQRKFYLLIGQGNNGKSVLLSVLKRMLGHYSWTLDSDILIKKGGGYSDNTHRAIGSLRGKRVAIANELPNNARFNDTLIKQLTGEETISGELKFKNEFEFKNHCKILISSNEAPYADPDSKAFYERLEVIPFKMDFSGEKQDKSLLEKLYIELPGILNWAIEGLKKYHEEGFKELPEAVIKASKEYRDDFDSLQEFIDERCLSGADKMVKGTIFLEEYKEYLYRNGYRESHLQIKELYRKLNYKGYKNKKGSGGAKFIYGIGLKVSEGEEK